MMDEAHATERGFTLVEVLVALVVSALLVTITMNAAVSARQRSVQAVAKQEALLLAETLIEARKVAPYSADEERGEDGDLRWSTHERAVLADPQGFFVLSEIEARVDGQSGVRLATLWVRKIKRAPLS